MNSTKKFDKFLEDNSCKEQYYENRNVKSLDSNDLIDGAFVWHESPEGHDYWSEINRKWHKLNPNN